MIRSQKPERIEYEKERARKRWQNMSEEEKEKKRVYQREYDKNQWHNNPEYRKRKQEYDKTRIRTTTSEQKKRLAYLKKERMKDPEVRKQYALVNRISAHNLRAQRGGLEFGLTLEQWIDIIKEHNGECHYCGNHSPIWEMEHLFPQHLGGGFTKSNIVPSCSPCNRLKSRKSDKEFIAYMRAHPEQFYYAKRIP